MYRAPYWRVTGNKKIDEYIVCETYTKNKAFSIINLQKHYNHKEKERGFLWQFYHAIRWWH